MSDATLYPMRTHADSACNPFEHAKNCLEKPVIYDQRRARTVPAIHTQEMLDNDTQKTLVHGPVRRPDHHVPLGERVRVDRDPVDRHLGNGTVLLADRQLLERI